MIGHFGDKSFHTVTCTGIDTDNSEWCRVKW